MKKILLVLLLIFIVAQFFGPEKNEGDLTSLEPFIQDTNPPEDVQAVLATACYDCHSSYTQYPWYNNITPVNYWLAEHVEDGKKHLDFSKWQDYDSRKKDHKLEEVVEMVEKKEMPLESYTWIHKDAQLSDEQITSMINWVKQARFKYSLESKPE